MSVLRLPAQCLVSGRAEGMPALLPMPLGFWGGFDPTTGRVIDRTHPACGELLTDRILVMPSGRGSSSASSILAEAIRARTAPAGILLSAPDPIIVVGAIVAFKLYGRRCPVVVMEGLDFDLLRKYKTVRICANPDRTFVELEFD